MKQILFIVSILFFTASSTSQTNKSRKMEAKKIDNIVVFGDGLNDMGRWGKLTHYQYPPAAHGFYESRWTNGKVWVEHFADSLGLALTLENNFAMGGATTGLYNINEPLRNLLELDSTVQLQGMFAQVQKYLTSNWQFSEKSLFVLWAGGHDIGNYLEFGQPDLQQYPPAANYKKAIELLVKAGAKHIFISTMPDMGYSPGYYGTDKQVKASELCQRLNKGLEEIGKTYKNTDVRIYKFDGAGVFTKIRMNPAEYGFKYTDAYLPTDIINFMKPLEKTNIPIPNKDKGLNPDEFMNWWAVSASARVHEIIAEEAIKLFDHK